MSSLRDEKAEPQRWTIYQKQLADGVVLTQTAGAGLPWGTSIEVMPVSEAEAKAWELDQMAIHAREDLALKEETLSVVVEDRDRQHAEIKTLKRALAQADAETVVLADALRAAGMNALLVQKIIDEAKPR